MKKLLGRIGLVFGGLIAAIVLIGLGAFAQNPVLIGRYWAVMTGADSPNRVDTLSPLERVKGGEGITFVLDPSGLTQNARAKALALVEPLNSQSLLVWHKGKLVLEWYGPGFSETSLSSPASMMKPVLALAVGAAIDRGAIKSLDDPVSAYLTEWKNDPRGAITVRQLITMSSGLQNAPFSLNPYSSYMASWLSSDVNAVVRDTKLARPPGSAFQYSNLNSQLLLMVLEKATGKRYADWLSETVWQPLGASDASVWLDRADGAARGYCCLITTGRDWLRVGLLIKDGGLVGSKQVIRAMWIDQMIAPSPRNPNFGFNIWRASPYAAKRSYGPAVAFTVPASAPFLAEDMVYFDGNGGQRVYISRANDLVIVRIGAPTMAWDDSALPNIVMQGLPSSPPTATR